MKKENYTTQLYIFNKNCINRISHIKNYIRFLYEDGLISLVVFENLYHILNGDYDTWYDFDEVLEDLD